MRPQVENAFRYLRQHPLFDGTSDAVVRDCVHLFVQRTYEPHSVLFEQGDAARIVYLVKRGKVRITRMNADGKDITLAILGPGDIFGEELAFHEQIARTTQAKVIEEAYLCFSRIQDFCAILSGHPIIAINVARYLQSQRNAAVSAVEDLAFLKVHQRIVRLFERLSHDHGHLDLKGTRIDVHLTHADIASLVGSTRETVTLELGRLARAGRILSINGYFVLPGTMQPA